MEKPIQCTDTKTGSKKHDPHFNYFENKSAILDQCEFENANLSLDFKSYTSSCSTPTNISTDAFSYDPKYIATECKLGKLSYTQINTLMYIKVHLR